MKEHGIIEIGLGIITIVETVVSWIIGKAILVSFGMISFTVGNIIKIIFGIILIWLGKCLIRDSESLVRCIGKTKIVEKELDDKWNDSKPKSTSNAAYSKTIGGISQKTIECPVCGKRNKASDECCSNCFSPLHDGYKKE